MSPLIIDLPDEQATTRLGADLIGALVPGDVLCLSGTLGTGKTALVRAAIQQLLGPETEVPSPTFTLVQTYDLPAGPLWHFDLYRISEPEEIAYLDWDIARDTAVVAVEWPDRLGPYLPDRRIDLTLTSGGAADARQAMVSLLGSWPNPVAGILARSAGAAT